MPPSSDAQQEADDPEEQQDADDSEAQRESEGAEEQQDEADSEEQSEAADSEAQQESADSDQQEADESAESDLQSVEIQEAEEVTIEEESDAGPDEGATVLHVLLEGLHVNLLGLEIHLPELDLDISAVPGEGRLLGNLLSGVAGLFDAVGGGGDGLLSGVTDLLGKLSPRSILGGITDRLASFIPFVGGSDGEGEASGDNGEGEDAESDGGDERESDGDAEDGEASEADESDESDTGILRSIGSKIQSGLGSLVPSLPIERALTWLVQTGLKRLVDAADQRAGGRGEESSEEGGTEEAAAADGGWVPETDRTTDRTGEDATTKDTNE